MRIVFMGTPDFAVASLDMLLNNGCNIVGVITAPDKLGGRGMKQIIQSPVKQHAVKWNLPVLQPEKFKNEDFINTLKSLKADLQVVVAFRMLPEIVWNMPPLGTFNLHGSLLPKYRGAAPINWAIINGEKTTGVTTFMLNHEIDTGNILMKQEVEIDENDNAGTLHDKLMKVGAELVLKTVKAIESNSITPQNQEGESCAAPKIFHETCEIDFNKPVEQVYNFIRGLSPYPGAWTTFNGFQLKIYETKKFITTKSEKVGKFEVTGKKCMVVYCIDGYLELITLQQEGKKRMNVSDFLNGLHH